MATRMWHAALARRGAWPVQALPIALLLAGAAVALWVALSHPPQLVVDVGGPHDSRFINGVLEAEVDRETGTSFRWFRPLAQVRLHGAEFAPVELVLRIHNSQPAEAGQRSFRVRYGDWAAATALKPGWQVYRFLLPATPSGAGLEAAPLVIEADPLRIATKDGIERSVAVDWVRAQPLASRGPIWRALALLWLLALLAGWLYRADCWWARWSPARRWLRVCLPLGACAAALAWWAASDPYTLAWGLPEAPWVLGIATIVLLVTWLGAIVRPQRAPLWLLAGAVVALLGGQALLNAQTLLAGGWGLALLGLGVAYLWDTGAPGEPAAQPATYLAGRRAAELGALLLIFLVALAMRFYRIAELPYGLWRDEARHGLEALHMLRDPGYRPAYILGGVDLPGLGLYPFMVAMRLWGPTLWSMRVVTGLAGALTIFPIYALARRLFGPGAVALLAAALLAVSSWHVSISRFSFPTIFDPLLQLTGLWLLAVGLGGTGRAAWRVVALVLAGACFGLALQTYHTGRLAPASAALLAVFLLLRSPRAWRWWLGGGLIAVLALLVAASGLLSYMLSQPSLFDRRVSGVALLGREDSQQTNRAPLTVLDESFGRHVMMFNVRGDQNGRHHAPDRPMLDFISGVGFLAGMAFCVKKWYDWRSQYLVGALLLGMVPSILSVDSPHAMRSIEALSFACMIGALGLAWLGRLCAAALARPGQPAALPGWLAPAVGALVLGLALAGNAWTYFRVMPADRRVWTSFYPIHTQVGVFLRDLAKQRGAQALGQVFVPASLRTNQVFIYLADGLPVQTFDEQSTSAPAAPGALFVVSGYSYPQDTGPIVERMHLSPKPLMFGPLLPDRATPSFVVYSKE